MPRLKHNQLDPLPITPLKAGRLKYHWKLIQKNKRAFDDFTPFSYEEFVHIVFSPYAVSYELGDGLGLCTFIFSGTNAYIQMVVYDYIYRDELCVRLLNNAFNLGATRITSLVTEDRFSARELVDRMHATFEGRMRKAYERDGEYLDVDIYGLQKEDFLKWQQQRV